MKSSVNPCRKCGEPVAVITWGVYRKVLVDVEAVEVVPDPEGVDFIRIDGSKIRGRIAEPGTLQPEYAYRPHRCGEKT